jgi:ketosteroid isomerase-like protein
MTEPIRSDLDEPTEALAARLISCIETGDTDGMAGCCHPDVTVWHNFDNLEVPLSTVAGSLSWLYRNVGDLSYSQVRRRALPDGYLQQHVVRGQAPGGELDLPACLIVEVRGGLISRMEEYLDTAALTVLRRPGQSTARS